MLPKINRLKKKNDFERVFKKGKSFKEDFLILRMAPNNLKTSRFGFVVSQKVSKKAFLRNKIKRRLRELIRLKLPQLREGRDGILIVSPGLEIGDLQKAEEKLNKLFKKARIIK